MDRCNLDKKCKKCDGIYKLNKPFWSYRNKGLVYCNKCGDVADAYEYSKMHDSIITKTDTEIENGINYFVVYYETKESGYRIADYINIEKSDLFDYKKDIKLSNLENLQEICLKHQYVKVWHKAIITQFGTDGNGGHGPDNPLINEWIYYFKDCRLHNEFGPAHLIYEEWCKNNPDQCIIDHENGISKNFGIFYIDGVRIGFRDLPNDKNCVSNDEEFLKCMKIKKLGNYKNNKNSSGIYEPPEICTKIGHCNERYGHPDGYHWVKELEDHKSDYVEQTINEHEKIYFGKGTKIHTVNGLIESTNDEPAVEFCCGQIKYWFKKNKLHRNTGPAIITNEIKKYFCNDEEIVGDEELINFSRYKLLNEILTEEQVNI